MVFTVQYFKFKISSALFANTVNTSTPIKTRGLRDLSKMRATNSELRSRISRLQIYSSITVKKIRLEKRPSV